MRDTLDRLRELWSHISAPNRLMLVAAVAGALVVLVGFLFWARTPEYVPLISNASPADSQGIMNFLKDRKVPYQIGQDGRTFLVPQQMRPELQMGLSAAGLMNSGSLGYGLLDKAPFGQTQAMEEQTIKRAVEGEMENAIEALDQVASANVKYAVGRESPFITEQTEPSASVIVHLKPGRELSKANTRAIANLVARAYPGLTTRNITMVDGESNMLWDGAQQGGGAVGTEERYAQERAYKEARAREIQQQIIEVVGPGKSSVIVQAELNLDTQQEEKREFTAGVPRTRETQTEDVTGAGGAPASARQPVGMSSNATPGGPVSPGTVQAGSPNALSGGAGRYRSERTNVTLDNGVTETRTIKTPGEVRSLAVSVMLDKSIPAETVAAIQRNIENYIGANPADPASARRVSVQTVTFDRTAREEEKRAAAASASAERINQWLGYGVPLAVMMLMLFILARSLRRAPLPKEAVVNARAGLLAGERKPALAGAGAGGGMLDITVGGSAEAGADSGTQEDEEDMSPEGVLLRQQRREYEIIQEAFDANLESIVHLARSKPETVAMLVKSWILEDKGKG